jgi:hypothetical protein
VFITIQDVNDNKPTFQTKGFAYTASIPENTQVGTAIFFQMGAIDNDREVDCMHSSLRSDCQRENNSP